MAKALSREPSFQVLGILALCFSSWVCAAFTISSAHRTASLIALIVAETLFPPLC
jgi:hypothetical protein